LAKYGLTTKETEVGVKIQKQDGSEIEIVSIEISNEPTIVYNVNVVEKNHNFFANEFLVHNRACFISGTEITLENGDVKNIEDIQIGDVVITLNEETQELEGKEVYEVLTPIHSELVTYKLEDGNEITSTLDHPYYSYDLELKSFDYQKTNDLYELPNTVTEIKIGDVLRKEEYGSEVVDIIIHDKKETQTYLLRVEDNHNYFANGILVHNK
jgi:intein/homing endonuclease